MLKASTCQVTACPTQPQQGAGLTARCSATSDQTAQPCPQACEGVTPRPHAVPCERHPGKGAAGRQWRQGDAGARWVGPLTHDLVLLQIDGLQRRQGGELLRKVAELVPRQVDGPEVLQGADLAGEPVQAVPLQAELCVWGEGSKGERGGGRDPASGPAGDAVRRTLPGPLSQGRGALGDQNMRAL